jgi:hypothetical protein
MPRKTTDKLLIKGNIAVHVCRKEASAACQSVPVSLSFAPAAKATFTEPLPAPLASGAPRPLTYFIELLSPRGRSAGQSNAARVLAGQAPAPVSGLSAQLRKAGVILRWDASDAIADNTVIRLHRTLFTPKPNPESPSKTASQHGLLAPPKEPLQQTLLVDSQARPARALDNSIRFGQTYEYRAQRVARVVVDGETVELAGPLSEPIRVEAIDTFPPAVPTGLAAVATAADSSAAASIDLSWQPISETDLAGYAVFRHEGESEWQRISPPTPIVGPAFHDTQVKPGHTYRYSVTAIDQLGHESARSVEAEETVPDP